VEETMGIEEKIDIELFKVVFKAMAQSDNLEIMANHLTQLLTATMEIKGCTIYALHIETGELEPLASFGLSMRYVNKGPLVANKSISTSLNGSPIVIPDVSNTDLLQYPEDARNEGIAAVVAIPITFYDKIIGSLRLYHHEIWNISEKDIDSLFVLAKNIGLAMAFTRLLKAFKRIKYTVEGAQTDWM